MIPEQVGFRGSFSGYERDRLFVRVSGAPLRFVDASYVLGLDPLHDGRAVAPVDLDGDGDLDLAMVGLQGLRLYENRLPKRHFARIRVDGGPPTHEAIGAIVELEAGGDWSRDHVKLTDGFQTQVARELHFGLDDHERIDVLRIHWPDGLEESWFDLPADRLLVVTRGASTVEARPLEAWPEGALLGEDVAPRLSAKARGLESAALRPLATRGEPVLVNFWAPWCKGCKEELPALARLAGRPDLGAHIVGVSVETRDLASVRASVAEHGLLYDQRVADLGLMQAFFGASEAALLPSTFVFDGGGRLRRIIRGATTERELSALLDSLGDEGAFDADLEVAARRALKHHRYEDAVRYRRRLLELHPGVAGLHHDLGIALRLLGTRASLEEATTALQRALALDPGRVSASYDLGLVSVALGRPREAADAFQAVANAGLDIEGLHLYLGIARADAGQLREASAALDRAVQSRPGSVEAWLIKARVHRERAQPAEARDAYTRALILDPSDVIARRELEALPPP